MSFRHVMQKVKEYPKHHKLHYNFNLNHDTDTVNTERATIIPLALNDDGIIATDVDSNPMHASFAEVTEPNCSPESKVFSISCKLQIELTKLAWNTDKLKNLKIQILPIAISFEDIDATDDRTSLTVGAILELMNGTDNMTHPIYNNVVIPKITDQIVDMGVNAQGLTATTALEFVTFDMNQLFQMLSFGSNRGKLKSCIGGIITRTLTVIGDPQSATATGQKARNNSGVIALKINLPSKAKFMNKRTFFGILIRIPTTGLEDNYGLSTDTTDLVGMHVTCNLRAHYLEWNHSYNHQRTG